MACQFWHSGDGSFMAFMPVYFISMTIVSNTQHAPIFRSPFSRPSRKEAPDQVRVLSSSKAKAAPLQAKSTGRCVGTILPRYGRTVDRPTTTACTHTPVRRAPPANAQMPARRTSNSYTFRIKHESKRTPSTVFQPEILVTRTTPNQTFSPFSRPSALVSRRHGKRDSLLFRHGRRSHL